MSDEPSMTTMKGLMVTAFGDVADVVKLQSDIAMPSIDPESDQMLIKVYYASIHMGDWKVSNGAMGAISGTIGFKPPYTPGQDYSGKVIQVGSGVQSFKIGDLVFGAVVIGHGSCAQYIIVTESQKEAWKLPVPDTGTLSLIQAAALATSYETAYQALVVDGNFQQGESILILGGSTVIGMYVTQMVRNVYGSTNITVTSSREDLCKSLGADTVINYKKQAWEQELKGSKFDVIFDVIGGAKSWNDCKIHKIIAPEGRYITVCGDFEADTRISCCLVCGILCGLLNRKCCSCCCGDPSYIHILADRAKSLDDALQLIVDGKVKVIIDDESPFKLEDYIECYKKGMERRCHGKLLLQLNDVDGEKNKEQYVQQHGNNIQEEEHDTLL
eukprot:228561_1